MKAVMGRPQTDRGKAIDLTLDIQVAAKAGIANEAYPLEARRAFARIAEKAWAVQALESGTATGDAWLKGYIDYMLGGYHGGEF